MVCGMNSNMLRMEDSILIAMVNTVNIEKKFRYIYCSDEEEDHKEDVSDKETDEEFDMFKKMYPGWAAHFDRQDELREALELIGYDPYEVEGRLEKEQREIIENLGFDYNLYNFNSYSGND